MSKVFIVGSGYLYARMFTERGWEVTTDIYEADLVQFTGGEDVTPSYYGSQKHRKTYNNEHRDANEKKVWLLAQELSLPCAGICRGGQFLNVMSGGSMYQDVDGHTGSHPANVLGMHTPVMFSSTHHQMMRPPASFMHEYLLLATAKQAKWREWCGTYGTNGIREYTTPGSNDDVECLYYPETNCLCFQPHPEFDGYKDCRDVYFFFINNYLLPNLNLNDALTLSSKDLVIE